MKVDIVVNSMIQQIDRNLQTQMTPASSFRPGDILRGRVMLTGDDRLQIRLDSGALLNALPAGDVMLAQGATVTLRVSGHMDGDLVMQLLGQELDGRQISGQAAPAEEAPAAAGMNETPEGRAVLQSMQRMGLPLREETDRQALEILQRYPGLEPDKAVFMAANRMSGTQTQVDTLNQLIDQHATTGDELLKLADILTSQASENGNTELLHESGDLPAAQAEESPGGNAAGTAMADELMAANTDETVTISTGTPQAEGAAQTAATPAAYTQGTFAPTPVQNETTAQDGMLRLQSLALVALGEDSAERYSGVIARLADSGGLASAASLALDGPFMNAEQLSGSLQAFEDSLPKGIAKDARAFVEELAQGVAKYAAQSYIPSVPAQTPGGAGVARVVREIMDMFVRVDEGDGSDSGATLAKAAGTQREGLARIAVDISRTGAASPEAARQLDAVSSHVRLLNDVSQYVCQQIPVQVNGKNYTAELYILNKGKRGKKINADSANMLVALDTEHMGRVEALASVSQKNLRLRFGVEKPDLIGYINSYTAELGRAMQEIGFRLSDMHAQVISKPVNPMTAAQAAEPLGTGTLDLKL